MFDELTARPVWEADKVDIVYKGWVLPTATLELRTITRRDQTHAEILTHRAEKTGM